ncbi:MAG: transcription-repair coupling factor [Anaerolineae bacterium]|nr:transcription-repair coupling factor [Anaerolineae bacterium]
MILSGLLDILREQPPYQSLLNDLDSRENNHTALGLIRAARPYLIAALASDTEQPVIVITARPDRAYNLAEQLLAWQPELDVLTFPEPNALPYEYAPWGPRTIRARVQVLARLADASLSGDIENTVVVTSARGLLQRTLPPTVLIDNSMTVEIRQIIPRSQPELFLRQLVRLGYEPVTVVTEAGTFSRRGGIIDVYPVSAEHPSRIELWGDEVESLRVFEPTTQRSLESQDRVIITPAREGLPLFGPDAAARLSGWQIESVTPADEALHPLNDFGKLEEGSSTDTLEFYLPWMVDDPVSLLGYLPENALVLIDDLGDLADTAADLEEQALDLRKTQIEAGFIPPNMPLPYITWGQIEDELANSSAVDLSGSQIDDSSPELGDLFTPGPRYAGELKRFLDDLRDLTRARRDRVLVVSRQAERLAGLWFEQTRSRLDTVNDLHDEPEAGLPVFVQGSLAEGWQLTNGTLKTLLFTDAEIFGWKRPEPRRRRQPRAAAPEDFFADLTPGDVVVHSEYGIGRFRGLEKRSLAGSEREFLIIAYQGGDILYVPIDQADRLSRYVGGDDSIPALSKLGSAEWTRIRQRTREAVEIVAKDLLNLYATRETVTGHAFSPDTPWQHELEASFPYVETDDQRYALNEVKADMEKPRPMDRLICGDVGYGKTEVALRAAFKAVMDGRQVAMLVPTTILAQQHFDTFNRRLAAFPVKVEMLSRFRTQAEQEAIIDDLTSGQVDIVIGTHRLLSGDVEFKNLGLLIIDEEQRFGVTHKEQFKQMRTEVDVLTLTATPIPRTLWMSLTGVRDISLINTAPQERLPVRTHVGKRDDNQIRQAILRELDRGGQVFYVHNRVHTIYTEEAKLKQIVPEAEFAVAHGQMNENELERVMNRFASGEIDVLISTSIIEAGLDFPNANTLIVDRADWFGLSQLYQLRGRVGRSANRAYAYFFHPSTSRLTPEARARLETISEHTDLGSGMNIAMRDLEIRGTGDILGIRQSGHISAIGFHLYTRMLSQAVRRLRKQHDGKLLEPDEQDLPREVVTIDLPIPTYIPTDYVPDTSLRIQLYRRMAALRTDETIADLGSELNDRFGPLPPPVENLLNQLRVKNLALRANIEGVFSEGEQISIRTGGLATIDRRALQARLGHEVRVSRTAIWLPAHDSRWFDALIDILRYLEKNPISIDQPETV